MIENGKNLEWVGTLSEYNSEQSARLFSVLLESDYILTRSDRGVNEIDIYYEEKE